MKRLFIVLIIILVLLVGGYVAVTELYAVSPLQLARNFFYDRAIKAQIPSLDRPIVNKDPLLVDFADQIIKATEEVVSILKKDWKNFDSWIQLGVNYKMLEDYEGARDAWEFAAQLRPEHPLPFHNLGNLYGYDLQDVVRAEENFIRAVTNGKNDIYIYYSAFEFYRDVKKDVVAARKVLEDGIANNPLQSDTLRAALKSL